MNRPSIESEIGILSNSLNASRIILTSRTGEISVTSERILTHQICPLTDSQIREFAFKYIDRESDAKIFLQKVFNSPFHDTAMRPINIAHLCAIYERYKTIPDRPKSVYKKLVNLLLEDWDSQRSIRRSTDYAGFTTDRKFDFLSRLSYLLTTNYATSTFSKNDLFNIYKSICADFQLPENEARKVVNEIETHNGLLVQSGFNQYEFSHKSIQEYLCAEFMVKSPLVAETSKEILTMPNEFAVATGLSGMPGHYFANIILNKLGSDSHNISFLLPFLVRLELEKPDFEISYNLGIAYSYLYTALLRKVNNRNKNKSVTEDVVIIAINNKADVQTYEGYVKLVEMRNMHKNIMRSIKLIRPSIELKNSLVKYITRGEYKEFESTKLVAHAIIRFRHYNQFRHTDNQFLLSMDMVKVILED